MQTICTGGRNEQKRKEEQAVNPQVFFEMHAEMATQDLFSPVRDAANGVNQEPVLADATAALATTSAPPTFRPADGIWRPPPFQFPGLDKLPAQNPYEKIIHQAMESCVTKAIISGGVGFGLGLALGTFSTSMEMSSAPDKTTTFRDAFKGMASRSYSLGKNFGMVGLVFSGVECGIEKYRAKHDIVNGTSAGCITGAAFALKGGPKAMLLGCAGFAAFSAAIDHFIS